MLPNLPNVIPQRSQGLVSAPITQPSRDSFYDLVVDGDLAKLNAEQRIQYLKKVTESLGLNPMTRPFGLIRLDNKVTLYALKEAATQLAKRDNVSVTLGEYIYVKDRNMLMVAVTARSPDGRSTDDVAAIPLGEKVQGEVAANAYMKLATKAKRRAILTHCGLGIIDESELDTIAKWEKIDERISTSDKREAINVEGKNDHRDVKGTPGQVEQKPAASETVESTTTDRETVPERGDRFDYNAAEDRQWLINAVKSVFPSIQRSDILALCSTFARAESKTVISQVLQKRLEIETENKRQGKPSLA